MFYLRFVFKDQQQQIQKKRTLHFTDLIRLIRRLRRKEGGNRRRSNEGREQYRVRGVDNDNEEDLDGEVRTSRCDKESVGRYGKGVIYLILVLYFCGLIFGFLVRRTNFSRYFTHRKSLTIGEIKTYRSYPLS